MKTEKESVYTLVEDYITMVVKFVEESKSLEERLTKDLSGFDDDIIKMKEIMEFHTNSDVFESFLNTYEKESK